LGLEATCAATLDGQTARGKAQLETTELTFRAASGGLRARIPLAEVETVTVAGKALTLKWKGGTLGLELGDAAAKWAEKIKNPPSRLQKLGVKSGARVAMIGSFEFDAAFCRELENSGATKASAGPVDVLFYAPAARAALGRIPKLVPRLDPAGALWVIRPKGKDTPVTEADTRKAGLDAGLVDVKVASFSATHTAEKFMIPVARRAR
jgi:hypothetical protein